MWPVRSFINTYYCRRQKEESRSQLQQLGELFDEQISDTQQQLLDQVIIQFQSHEPLEGIIMIYMEAPISPGHTDKCRIARLFSFFCTIKKNKKAVWPHDIIHIRLAHHYIQWAMIYQEACREH